MAMADTCPKCGAPAKRTVNMRGGDYGWSTTDEERADYKYEAPPAGAGEAVAFVAWAESAHHVMDRHPLHFLFLDRETNIARQAWKAAIAYAAPTPLPEAVRDALLDAARYRWLRVNAAMIGIPGGVKDKWTPADLDAAIDRAINGGDDNG
jgi:hypothetical protein